MLVVLIVFGCIIVSFALSSLKQRADIVSWSVFAGSAFNNLGEEEEFFLIESRAPLEIFLVYSIVTKYRRGG